jgi:hypothetical protein
MVMMRTSPLAEPPLAPLPPVEDDELCVVEPPLPLPAPAPLEALLLWLVDPAGWMSCVSLQPTAAQAATKKPIVRRKSIGPLRRAMVSASHLFVKTTFAPVVPHDYVVAHFGGLRAHAW